MSGARARERKTFSRRQNFGNRCCENGTLLTSTPIYSTAERHLRESAHRLGAHHDLHRPHEATTARTKQEVPPGGWKRQAKFSTGVGVNTPGALMAGSTTARGRATRSPQAKRPSVLHVSYEYSSSGPLRKHSLVYAYTDGHSAQALWFLCTF